MLCPRSSLLKTLGISLLLMVTATASAHSGPTCSATSPTPVALTLSGGVSLGTHQAGFLYYVSSVFQKNPEVFEPRVMTGSSAGGLNTFLSLLTMCQSQESTPTKNQLWRAWVGMRAQDLNDPKGRSSKALLSKSGFENALLSIHQDWQRGLPKSCDFVLGITASRLEPRSTQAGTNLTFSRQDEKFVLRITGRGPNLSPTITNYVNSNSGGRQILLHLVPGDDAQNYSALHDLLIATSAFPLAFAPQKITYCLTKSEDPRWLHADFPLRCQPHELESAEFLDGGLIDNKPLGLADRLSRAALEPKSCGASRIRNIPMPLFAAPRHNREVLHILSDTGARAYQEPRGGFDKSGALSLWGQFLHGFTSTVRSRDSVSALEEDPQLALQIASARNHFPRIGEPFLGFFGFFETDFRAFDFYLGMIEARSFIREEIAQNLKRGNVKLAAHLKYPEAENSPEWNTVDCLEGILKNGARPPVCEQNKNSNLEILAHLSNQRLKRFSRDVGTTYDEDLDFIFRYLAERKFTYRDLELKSDQSGEGAAKMKTVSLKIVEQMAEEQPQGESTAVAAALPVILNSIAPLPTERYGFITTGPATRLGASILQGGSVYPSTLRYAAGLQIENLQNLFSQQRGHAVVSPWLGVELEPQSWSSTFVQSRMSLNLGYRLRSFREEEMTDRCASDRRASIRCRGIFAQGGFSTTFLERLRLELLIEAMPPTDSGSLVLQLLPAMGVQLHF